MPKEANRLIKSAHFSASSATIEGIEYYEDRKLDKTQILRLTTCNYIDEGHHVILKGSSGNGKTYIACALGNAACRHLKRSPTSAYRNYWTKLRLPVAVAK